MGYIVDLYNDSYENNLNVAVIDKDTEKNYIYSVCKYNNINNK